MTPDRTRENRGHSADRRGVSANDGQLKFFYGPMDCGKSTLALQLDYNRSREGLSGLLLTKLDRSKQPQISSRIGITRPAVDVDDDADLGDLVRHAWSEGQRVDYLIVDEAQFFTPDQIDQMAKMADEMNLDVYAFGIATDFRGRLFPGSARLFELADEAMLLQVEVLCWCGRTGRFNARIIGGQVAREGDQVVVADTFSTNTEDAAVHYRVLCRRHYRIGDLGPSAGSGTLLLTE